MDQELFDQARSLLELCRTKKLRVASAESCTGGLVAATLTEVPGSSSVVECGFVTYSNQAKHDLLAVPYETLATYGAVSRETARAMAAGALAHAPVELAVAVTGIAGPQGGTTEKPVGLVCFAAMSRSGGLIDAECRYGAIGRAEIRKASVKQALALLRDLAGKAQIGAAGGATQSCANTPGPHGAQTQ
jgi:nicotinamide-nucleotide amidase